VPAKEHASPSFNLPNYPACRQEKSQEFLRRPDCCVSSREDEVSYGYYHRKPGNVSIGSKQIPHQPWQQVKCRVGAVREPPLLLWIVFFAYSVQIHFLEMKPDSGEKHVKSCPSFDLSMKSSICPGISKRIFLTSHSKIRSHHN